MGKSHRLPELTSALAKYDKEFASEMDSWTVIEKRLLTNIAIFYNETALG